MAKKSYSHDDEPAKAAVTSESGSSPAPAPAVAEAPADPAKAAMDAYLAANAEMTDEAIATKVRSKYPHASTDEAECAAMLEEYRKEKAPPAEVKDTGQV